MRAARTRAGEAAPSAEIETASCAAFASTAVYQTTVKDVAFVSIEAWTKLPLITSASSPSGTSIGDLNLQNLDADQADLLLFTVGGMTGYQRVRTERHGQLITCEQPDRSSLVGTSSAPLEWERQRQHENRLLILAQATNLMEAVAFAREIRLPLTAHATIHWVGTKVGDDPDGRLFAKIREGFDKWLRRQGIPGGLTAIWVRERLNGGLAEVVHCHMLFHLPQPFIRARKRIQVEGVLERLIDRHGGGNYADYTLKLTFPVSPNGIYLIKGGGPEVWRRFSVPSRWRKPQGLVHGKRCGTTENIGRASRQKEVLSRR